MKTVDEVISWLAQFPNDATVTVRGGGSASSEAIVVLGGDKVQSLPMNEENDAPRPPLAPQNAHTGTDPE